MLIAAWFAVRAPNGEMPLDSWWQQILRTLTLHLQLQLRRGILPPPIV